MAHAVIDCREASQLYNNNYCIFARSFKMHILPRICGKYWLD